MVVTCVDRRVVVVAAGCSVAASLMSQQKGGRAAF
jgi:hypothetical protein